jgi:hypothetical protein
MSALTKKKFSVRLLPEDKSDLNGQPMGQIEIGSFRECFSCYPFSIPISDFEARWRAELISLVEGARTAFLQYEPKFAWVVYREGEHCFVREVLAMDGYFSVHSDRSIYAEGEHKVSEWTTTVSAVRRFLEAEPGADDNTH